MDDAPNQVGPDSRFGRNDGYDVISALLTFGVPDCCAGGIRQRTVSSVYNSTVGSFQAGKARTMEPDHTQGRQQAHALLDMLSAEKLIAVRGLLEVMVEPLSRLLALAPVEDEEITPETAAALDRARASLS